MGTVFKLNTDGSGFTTLHNFTGGSDGAFPEGSLILSGSTLYGTTLSRGVSGYGTVFSLNTDGSGFMTLHAFTGGTDGSGPQAKLILSGNTLYGTASRGGLSGNGTVFSISLLPQLTISATGPNLVLSWPSNFSGFVLQASTNLASSAWITNLPPPVLVNGQNTVTDPISGTQQFFRLSE